MSRSYSCSGCGGVVSIPGRLRRITLEQVRKTHESTCPHRRGNGR